jgi:hypothetical protein
MIELRIPWASVTLIEDGKIASNRKFGDVSGKEPVYQATSNVEIR